MRQRFVVTRNKKKDYTAFWLMSGTGVPVPNHETYRNIHGHSVTMNVRGWKVEFEWRDERGKREAKDVADNPVTVYGRMISIRLAGYEATGLASEGPTRVVAVIQSMDLPFEIIELGEAAATVSMLDAIGDFAKAVELLSDVWPRVRDLQDCALTTLSRAINVIEPLPRNEWLEAVRMRLPWAAGSKEHSLDQ